MKLQIYYFNRKRRPNLSMFIRSASDRLKGIQKVHHIISSTYGNRDFLSGFLKPDTNGR
ncbi:hypothetical protein HQN84_16660 [Pedobacter steynii]|uniref:hypothetical protein n=1 Tax=Pedobacter steynii TaxID=430522 RepID=UPI00155D9131|nr:hypothetical protein [Pedobacter steynii]NQX40482.1 hypothetical protein [Pedobacter steynii]